VLLRRVLALGGRAEQGTASSFRRSARATQACAIWRWMSTCSAQYPTLAVVSVSRSTHETIGIPPRGNSVAAARAPSARAKTSWASDWEARPRELLTEELELPPRPPSGHARAA